MMTARAFLFSLTIAFSVATVSAHAASQQEINDLAASMQDASALSINNDIQSVWMDTAMPVETPVALVESPAVNLVAIEMGDLPQDAPTGEPPSEAVYDVDVQVCRGIFLP